MVNSLKELSTDIAVASQHPIEIMLQNDEFTGYRIVSYLGIYKVSLAA